MEKKYKHENKVNAKKFNEKIENIFGQKIKKNEKKFSISLYEKYRDVSNAIYI